MRDSHRIAGACALLWLASLPSALAEETKAPPPLPRYGLYEPSPAHPWGRRNPAAPAELEQFAFMLGENACTDRIRQADGSWNEFPARWNAVWFLNGHGIQDRYWTPSELSTPGFLLDRGQSAASFPRLQVPASSSAKDSARRVNVAVCARSGLQGLV